MRKLRNVLVLVAVSMIVFPHVANADVVVAKMAPEAWASASSLVEARQVLDYGSFLWVELEDYQLDILQTSGVRFQAIHQPFTLTLGEARFDPVESPRSSPEGWGDVSNTAPDLQLIQVIGPTQERWLTEIQNSGFKVVQYIHPHSYVVWGQKDALERLHDLQQVRWTGSFAPEFRVLPRWRNLPSDPVEVDVLMYRGADTDKVVTGIRGLGATFLGRRKLNHVWEQASFVLRGDLFAEAARMPGVYSIQPQPKDGGLRGEMSNQINVNNYDVSNLAFPGYLTWLSNVGLDGSGVIMANVDGGIQHDHVDLVGRMLGCTGTTCGGAATDSHGTHTAGIMAADGASGSTAGGFLRGLGVAPGANLVEQVYSPFYTQAGGMLLLIGDSYANNAVLSGNSWGPSGSPLGYDDDTLQVDIGVRDADDQAAGNQPFSYVLSFMNGNGGTSSQGTPDEAKNIFTIGSTKMQSSSTVQILEIDDVSSNSAHGPALDGRTIPHMVAPGCSVDSSVPTNSYGLMCGTSMASPHVAGAVGLFFEHYRNLMAMDPSPALVKAAFLPVTHDLAGNSDADGGTMGHPFDSKQGWGRMDLEAVVDSQVPVIYFDDPLVLDATSEEWASTVGVANANEPVRIMLVWTDAPGHGLGGSTPAWNNDLDLVVEAGGSTYLGNNFALDGLSTTGGSPDGMNNTEGVFLAAGGASFIDIRVLASDINSDGIPGIGDATDQDFALVCYNCILEPDFSLSSSPLSSTVCAPAEPTVTISVSSILGYSAPVTLTVSAVPAGLTTSFDSNPVTPPVRSHLTIGNTAAAPGSHELVVEGTSGTNIHQLFLPLTISTELPGTATLLAPSNGALNQSTTVTLTWSTVPGGGTYEVQVATDGAFQNIVDTIADFQGTSWVPSGLATAVQYYWRVQASNGCGTDSWSSLSSFSTIPAAGECSPGTTPVFFLAEDFDLGDPGWLSDGIGSTWALSQVRANSGANAYHAENPAVVSDQRLVTPVVALPASGSALTLQFWNYQDIENSGTTACWDGGVIEVSTDGNTWTSIENEIVETAYDGPVSNSFSNPLGDRRAWCATARDWRREIVDLTTWAGQTVSFRFRLGTDNIIGREGWYVDDLVVQGCPESISTIFADGFESGSTAAWSGTGP